EAIIKIYLNIFLRFKIIITNSFKKYIVMSLLLEKFLIKNNYTHFNKNDISLQLLIHPNNPSFRAMTDTLDYFGIDNVAANVPEQALELLPDDFLTVIEDNGSKLVLATK